MTQTLLSFHSVLYTEDVGEHLRKCGAATVWAQTGGLKANTGMNHCFVVQKHERCLVMYFKRSLCAHLPSA